jgi:outer membrane protein insertion porin family
VNFKTAVAPESPDLLNVDVVVKERHTGSIMLGAGYGSATGGSFNGRVSESNFLGKGQFLSAALESGQSGTTFNIGFTEPHLYDSNWSSGFDLYQSVGYRSDYDEKDLGGGLRFGHPIQEDINWYLRYKLVRTTFLPRNINGIDVTDRKYFPLEDAQGKTSSLTATIEMDQRNDRFSPSKGIFASASSEYAGPGGDTHFIKTIGTFRYFKKVFWDVVWRNNITYGVLSYPDDQTVPFNELFLLGGPYSLRGYSGQTVGRKVFSEKAYDYYKNQQMLTEEFSRKKANKFYGGKQQLYYSTELEFPLIPEAGIKGVTFYDVGQADDVIDGGNFFGDVGFGFRWFSPLGPLRFEWGFPLNRDPDYHLPSNFEFSIGSPF